MENKCAGNVKVSIIVPVYKVEQYLSKCIESIIGQSYQNWELLLIDDGSPDNSGRICDEYAQKDTRIRVFHKENKGVSSARNLGLDNTKGEYIMFVDSDDWLSHDCLEVCINEVYRENLDALQFGYISVTSAQERPFIKKATLPLDGETYIGSNSFNVCVWGGLYKRLIIEENNLRFPLHLKLAEDQVFVLSFLKLATSIKYLDKGLYYYLQRQDSAVHSSKSKDMLLSCRDLIGFSKNWPVLKSHVDSMIEIFILEMIKNNDVPYKTLKEIYREQGVISNNHTQVIMKIFSVLVNLNFYLACFVVHMNNLRNQYMPKMCK